ATIDGGLGDDDLTGSPGNDLIFGRQGSDVLDGYTGNDDLDGGLNNDTLFGGNGSDILRDSSGGDTFDGDLRYSGFVSSGDVDTLVGMDTRDNVFTVTGSDSGDLNGKTFVSVESLRGGDRDDTFDLGRGGLTGSLKGGRGRDTLTYESTTFLGFT